MKRIVPYIAALVSLVSCEYQFDVVSSDKTSMLFVESIVGLDDAASDIKVLKTIPVGTPKESSLEVRGLSGNWPWTGRRWLFRRWRGSRSLCSRRWRMERANWH